MRPILAKKDAQQLIVIKRMVEDLNLPVKIIGEPIVREADGLAMSSRNVYLTTEERQQALVLSQAMKAARKWLEAGERDGEKIKAGIRQIIAAAPLAEIDYVEAVDGQTLQPLASLSGRCSSRWRSAWQNAAAGQFDAGGIAVLRNDDEIQNSPGPGH